MHRIWLPDIMASSQQDVLENQQYQSDENILCDDCDKMYSGECPQHGPLEWIKTLTPVDSSHFTPSMASLPEGLLLKESCIPDNDMGVFASRLIYKRTMFGPFEGKKITAKDHHDGKDLTYSWDVLQEGIPSCILDGSDEKHINWMRFVTYARDKREQNLIAFQYRGQIFYRTFRDVYPGEELMVWYEDEYTCSLDELQTECKDQIPEYACQRCHLVFAGSTYLYKHHKFRCPDGPLLSTYGTRTTGLVGALFRLPVLIANDSWSTPINNNTNESKPRPESENHHGRRKNKPRKLPRPQEMEEAWKPEQPFGPPCIEWNADPEPVAKETTTVLLPPETQMLDANDSVEIENYNSNYLKRLTSDEVDDALPQEKRQKVDNEENDDFDEKYPYHCGACGKAFARPTWWAKHESGCFKNKNKENQAGQANSTVAEQPKSAEKKQRKEPYTCNLCGKAFACPSWLVRHMRTHKNTSQTDQVNSSTEDEPMPYVCKDCGRGFLYPSRLERHRKSNHASAKSHPPDARGFVCRDCGRSFAVQSWLTRHRAKAHNNAFVAKKHMCGVCGRSFVLAVWLERHMKVHQGTIELQPTKEQVANESSTSSNDAEAKKKAPELPWVCGECGCRFKFISWLTRHQKNTKHSDGYFDKQDKETVYKWVCDQPGCDKAYKMKHHLGRHKLTHLRDSTITKRVETETGGKFICQEANCGREFETKRMFTRHKFRHLNHKKNTSHESSDELYVCKKCDKVFGSKKLLERHSKRVHGILAADGTPQKPGPPYPCRYCGEEYKEPLPLGRHVASCKKKEERAQAAASLLSQASLQQDTKNLKSELKMEAKAKSGKQRDDLAHDCDICGRSFAVSFWLTRHKAEHEFDQPHQCDECGRTFAVSSWLTRHKREHSIANEAANEKDESADLLPEPITRGNSKVYRCEVCGMEFASPSWLIRHRKLHKLKLTEVKEKSKKKTKAIVEDNDGTSALPNEDGSYEGKNANDMFILIDKNGIKTYECKVCKKTTVWHTGIIYHIRVHHTKEKPFKCKLCTKAFHMAGDLTKHVRRHAGERPFQCRQCNKCFATSQELRNHNIVHGGKRSESFHCTGCGKVYTDRSSVWRHIRRTACPGKCARKKTSKTESTDNIGKTAPPKENMIKTEQEKKTEKIGKLTKAEKASKVKKIFEPASKGDKQVEQDPKQDGKKEKNETKLKEDKSEKEETKLKEDKKVLTKKDLTCKNCHKTFPNSDAFKAHIEYYKKKKQIVCEYCGKCWVRIADLTRHIRVHTNERPYPCPECSLAFKVSDALRRHMRQLHPKSTKNIIRVKTEPEQSSHSHHANSPPTKRTKMETEKQVSQPRSERAKALRRGKSEEQPISEVKHKQEKPVKHAKSEKEKPVQIMRKEGERHSKRLRSNSSTSIDSKEDEKDAEVSQLQHTKTRSKKSTQIRSSQVESQKVVKKKHEDVESENSVRYLESETKNPRKSAEHVISKQNKSGENSEMEAAKAEQQPENSNSESQNSAIPVVQANTEPAQPSETELDKPAEEDSEETAKPVTDEVQKQMKDTDLELTKSTKDDAKKLESTQSNPTDSQPSNVAQEKPITSPTELKPSEPTQPTASNDHSSEITIEPNGTNVPNSTSFKDVGSADGKPQEPQPVAPIKTFRGRKSKRKNGKHKCEYCGKFFAGPANVIRHVRLHTGEKPFKCKHCGECFMRTDVLYQHIVKRHNNEQ